VNDDYDVLHFEEEGTHEDDAYWADTETAIRNCDDDIIGAVYAHPALETVMEYWPSDKFFGKTIEGKFDNTINRLCGIHVEPRIVDDAFGSSSVQPNDLFMNNMEESFKYTRVTNYCYRDLEDFDRLHLRIDSELLKAGAVTYHLKFVGEEAHSPSINLFKAVCPDLFYITGKTKKGDNDVAEISSAKKERELQMDEKRLLTIEGEEVQFPEEFELKEHNNFLYEGKSVGKGSVIVEARCGGLTLASASLHMKLCSASNLLDTYECRETTPKNTDNGRVNEWDVSISEVKKKASAEVVPWNCEDDNVVIFILGWNVMPDERSAWGDMVMKRLFWQQYKGRTVQIWWPCLNGFKGTLIDACKDGPHFDRSEHRARLSAEKVAPIISEIAKKTKHVTLIAHSQGNVLVGEMLRLLDAEVKGKMLYLPFQAAISAQHYTQKYDAAANPKEAQYQLKVAEFWKRRGTRLGKLWNLIKFVDVPDVIGHYSNGFYADTPYLENQLKSVRTVNFFNRHDYALNIWVMNNASKPDNLEGTFKRDTSFGYKVIGHTDSGERRCSFVRHTDNGDVVIPFGKVDLASPEENKESDKARSCVFSFVVPTKSLAMGQLNMEDNVFKNVDLGGSEFKFKDTHYYHSKQFRSNVTDEYGIWKLVKDEIDNMESGK